MLKILGRVECSGCGKIPEFMHTYGEIITIEIPISETAKLLFYCIPVSITANWANCSQNTNRRDVSCLLLNRLTSLQS